METGIHRIELSLSIIRLHTILYDDNPTLDSSFSPAGLFLCLGSLLFLFLYLRDIE